ncbi:hypothetical protein L1987_47603 [Smallanthus sonchifolius]|uniref:Uncharacterized protein n=1 Tax=Smallanthus sonchifolius TaxID=185202 RepID=A0ACB9G3Z1_9ASTR|nr:hypothetical protein L1987_47603 [Smallanthus sonchifolius]
MFARLTAVGWPECSLSKRFLSRSSISCLGFKQEEGWMLQANSLHVSANPRSICGLTDVRLDGVEMLATHFVPLEQRSKANDEESCGFGG